MPERLPSPAGTGELHARLRNATRELHHELDRHPLLAPLVRNDLGRGQYGHALVALHGAYVVLEAAVCAPATAAGFDYGERRKVPALEADLRELGLGFRPCGIAVPPPDGVAALVGMLYTIEGSTLGARAISRQLARGAAGTLPMRYFSGYGEATLARWQAFWDFAERVCPSEAADAACGAAAMTFRLIGRHLDEVWKEQPLYEPPCSPLSRRSQ